MGFLQTCDFKLQRLCLKPPKVYICGCGTVEDRLSGVGVEVVWVISLQGALVPLCSLPWKESKNGVMVGVAGTEVITY